MRALRFGVLALVLATNPACKKDQETASKEKDEAKQATTAPTAPVLNKDIANAVASASKQAAKAENTSSKDGPPPDGIFTQARADKEFPQGQPAKLEVASTGSAPKLSLAAPELPDKLKGTLTMSVRTGPMSALPTVTFDWEFKGSKSKEGGSSDVHVDVKNVALSAQQMGAVPPQLKQEIEKLKGSAFDYQTKDGAIVGEISHELGKKANKNVDAFLGAGGEALGFLVATVPKEPVGKGAIWMVSYREHLTVGEVVTYNLYKVEDISPERAKLSVQTQRYIVNPEIDGNRVLQFKGSGNAELVLVPGQRMPLEGTFGHRVQALVQTPSGSPSPVQWDMNAQFKFPGVAKAAGAAAAAGKASANTKPASATAP